jgi:TolB-like protein
LTRAFERKEHGIRLRSQVVDPLTKLSTLPGDNYDEWVTDIHQYYDHFEALHSWSKLLSVAP